MAQQESFGINFCPCCGFNMKAVQLSAQFMQMNGTRKAIRKQKTPITDEKRDEIKACLAKGLKPAAIMKKLTGVTKSQVNYLAYQKGKTR